MWIELIITALSSGSLGGAVAWLFSKGQRDNSFIPKLQSSIENLTDNYTRTLNRMVVMEGQNAELLIGQGKLELELMFAKKEAENTMQQLQMIKEQNVDLLKIQAVMQGEINILRKENSNLIKKVNELNRLLKDPEICKTQNHS